MNVALFLIPWVLIGIGVLFVSFSGGPSRAREAYLTGGGAFFTIVIAILYVGIGIAVPTVVLADSKAKEGATPYLKTQQTSGAAFDHGKTLFLQTCKSCHTLAAVNARGVTGPNLDNIGKVTPGRLEAAIKAGGTGEMRMPPGLLQGQDAKDVALFVSQVAQK